MKYSCQLILIILCIFNFNVFANDDFEEFTSNDNSSDTLEEYTTSFKDSIEYLFQTNNTEEILNLLNEEPSLIHTPLYNKNTLLHLSCLYGRTQILDFAVKNKLSLNTLNKDKQTLWHMAGMSKQNACMLFLLEQVSLQKNKELMKSFSQLDSKKNSFIYYHLMYQNENVDLLKSILNINTMLKSIDLNMLNGEGYGLVHVAKSYSKQQSLQLLKESGADLTIKNKNNMTIFDY